MSLNRSSSLLFSLIVILVFSTACGPRTVTPTPTSVQAPSPTATPTPPKQLTICLGQEPASLFPVNNISPAALSVLAAIYDGPIDSNTYSYQPVILERLPSIGNGDAQVFAKEAAIGDEVVDASGTPITLTVGARVRPAGCTSDSCAIEYDGASALQMDQMQVTFRLLPSLTWSDGEPLTADDSVFAFQVASDSSTGGSKYLEDRTLSYEATDTLTVQWWGKPGFIDPTYFTNFWPPLPKHLWEQVPINQMAETEETSRTPLGWGAYAIQEWAAGDHITLVKNPLYFRASEGLPKFDILTYRFEPDAGTAISDLLSGACDILDPSIRLDGQVDVLRSMAGQGQLQALFSTVPVMEELALGIQPAAFDAGGAGLQSRPNFFGDARVRQAIAMCLDRQQVVNSVLGGLTYVPNTYVPKEDPLFNLQAAVYTFDVAAAGKLLDDAGWRDTDNDPSTPRVAVGIQGISPETPFEVNYVTTNAVQRQQVSTILAGSLAQCGIKVNVQYLDSTSLYAPGPDGLLFGRNFELAEFAMGSTGIEPPCDWFTNAATPNKANRWVGENVSGYSNPTFDAVCQDSQQTLPDDAVHTEAYNQAQTIFADDLPVIPLYWRIKIAAARPGICKFSLDPTAASEQWGIEAYDSGAGCQP